MLVTLAATPAARADWELKRTENDARLLQQIKDAVRRDPHDARSLGRLVAAYRKKPRGLDALIAELGERSPAETIAKARVLLLAKRDAEAASILQRACAERDLDTRCWLLLAEHSEAPAAIEIYDKLRLRALDAATEQKVLRELVGLLVTAHDVKQHAALLTRLRPLAQRQIVLGGDDARRRWADTLQKLDEPKEAALALAPLVGKERDPQRKAAVLLEQSRLYELAKLEKEEAEVLEQALVLVPRGSYLYRELVERVLSSYRRREELRALGRLWEQKWPRDKRNFVEWEALGRLYDELGDSPAAEAALSAALKADPRSVDVWRRLIQLHDRHAQTEQAIAAYRSLIKIAPGEPRFRLELAERLHQSRGVVGGKQEALKLCKEVSKLSRDPGAHTALADLYTRWGYLDLALAERRLLEQLEPNEEGHRIAVGEILYSKGDKAQAIEIWRGLANQGGKKDAHLGRVAEILAEHDELALALETFRKARELQPNDINLLRGLAGALERAGQLGEAENHWVMVYERAIAAEDLAVLGEARHRLAQLAGPRNVTQRASLYEGRAVNAHAELAITAWVLLVVETTQHLTGNDVGLRTIAKHQVRITRPELRADLLVAKANLLRNSGRAAEAIVAYEQASELAPSRKKELLARSAELSLQLYRDADALGYAKRAVEAAPNDAAAQLRLAEVHLRRDEADLATAAYERAITLDPRQWKIYFELSRLHVAGGAPERAAQLLRQVMRRAPDEQFVLDAARRAVDLEEYLGTLHDLEKELAPLMLANPERREYRALLIDVYERLIRPLSRAERAGDESARPTLAKLADRAQRPLLDLLIDGDGQQQALAVALLGELGGSGAATPLLKLALSSFDGGRVPRAEKDGTVKAYTLRLDAALAGAQAATPAELLLLEKLATAGEKHFRIAGYLGLGRLRDAPAAIRAKATQRLLAGLDDEIPEAAAAACAALGPNGGRALDGNELQRILLILGEAHRAEALRAGCATALGRAAATSADEKSVQLVLSQRVSDGGELLARQAAWALRQRRLAGESAAIDALIDAALGRSDSVRAVAIAALREPQPHPITAGPRLSRGAEGVDLRGWLTQQSRPRDGAVDAWDAPLCARQAAALARRAPSLLVRHEDLANRTLHALQRCAAQLPRPLPAPLAAALGEVTRKQPALASAATSLLSPDLLALPGAPPRGLPTAIDHPIAAGAKENIEWWLAAATAADWRERLAAVEATALVPATTASPVLQRLLRDPSGYVREAALVALVGQPIPLAELQPLVDDPAAAVRIALVPHLRHRADAATLLSRLRADRDPEVAKIAADSP